MGKKEMEGIAWDGRIADDEFEEKHVIYVGLLILCLFMGFKLGTIRIYNTGPDKQNQVNSAEYVRGFDIIFETQ